MNWDPKFGRKMNARARVALDKMHKEQAVKAKKQAEDEAHRILKEIPVLADAGSMSCRFELKIDDMKTVANILEGFGLRCEILVADGDMEADELDVNWAQKEAK